MGTGFILAATAILAALTGAAATLARCRSSREEARKEIEALRAEAALASARLADSEENCRRRIADREAACRALLEEKDAACERLIRNKDEQVGKLMAEQGKAFSETVKTLRERFANLAEEKLRESAAGLSELNGKNIGEIVRPFREQLEAFKKAFEDNTRQQVANKASFDQAINDLGNRALKIGEDAENLARALKNESKTQGDWGEMVLANILSAAGLKEGVDFELQARETDAEGNCIIPDVEIKLPDGEKLLIDSKASVTAYLDYVAASGDDAREAAAKEHVASVRRHMDELAEKDYARKIRGAQGYILMFIPNEGSYLLAMERDRKLPVEAFRRHVIIVNPTTLLLCLQIVMLLRSREAQNEKAERVLNAAAGMYEKFCTFADTFADIGKRIENLDGAYKKAHGQLIAGPGNVIRQLESLKGMGVLPRKSLNQKLLDSAQA